MAEPGLSNGMGRGNKTPKEEDEKVRCQKDEIIMSLVKR